MNTDKPIQRVLVVGGGTAGWMAAAVLSRCLPKPVAVTLIESEQIGTVGVGEATIPQIRLLNHLLGIDEHQFLAATNGSYKLGIEFENWGALGDRYIHAFGGLGQSLGMARFWAYWLRARQRGRQDSLWDYSVNAVAAKQHRFAPLDRVGDTQIEGLVRAYHFDAGLFAAYLRSLSEQAGVTRIEGMIAQTRLADDGQIAAVTLQDGRDVTADLFIDCSGFRGLLIGDALGVGYEDWRHWLPCDRAVTVASDPLSPLPPFTRATAHTAGWQWRIPLQTRTGNGHVYCSGFVSDDEAEATLLQHLPSAQQGEPRQLRFTTGRREQFWFRNCVALGLASGFMEPLESTSIHLVQSGLSRLLALFPTTGLKQSEVDEYNRQTAFEYARIRDFLILHYVANQRDDSEFWRARRDADLPDSLRHRLDLFKANGRIFRDADELFTEVGWLQVLIGQNQWPTHYDPLADHLTDQQLDQFLQQVGEIVAAAVKPLPLHEDYLARSCKTGRADSS
ncbi:MAG: tryptophan halogenase family protein [Pseudomonadota bacterium]